MILKFKARVIDNKRYYVFRRKQLFFMFIPVLPYPFFANFLHVPAVVSVYAFIVYVFLWVLYIKNQQKLQALVGNTFLEVSENKFELKAKGGQVSKVFFIADMDKIVTNNKYVLIQENMGEIVSEMRGAVTHNFLTLKLGKQQFSFDFEIDSFYMIKQLEKLIDLWKSNGMVVERVA